MSTCCHNWPWCEHVTAEESKAYNEAKAKAYGWDKLKPPTKPKKKRKKKSRGNQ